MYLMYVDESGSHGLRHSNRAYILAGVAVHERDVGALGGALDEIIRNGLDSPLEPDEYELHAAELRAPRAPSPWRDVDGQLRRRLLEEAVAAVSRFGAADPAFPLQLFVEVLPPGGHHDQEAYGRLLNRFDDWLEPYEQQGLVLSDVNRHDREIQRWAEDWRETAGPWGRLDRLTEVPLFADSRASRLLQAADLVAWSSWRRFGIDPGDPFWWDQLAPRVHLTLPGA
ncbi:MAG: DUF3800 domain-containing protein [Solirubrobacteraceae bacterium]|nr:DUF3800 domain-containing protein [Solirubrobacteraceae bacterium]